MVVAYYTKTCNLELSTPTPICSKLKKMDLGLQMSSEITNTSLYRREKLFEGQFGVREGKEYGGNSDT